VLLIKQTLDRAVEAKRLIDEDKKLRDLELLRIRAIEEETIKTTISEELQSLSVPNRLALLKSELNRLKKTDRGIILKDLAETII
jgi:hypothetical protein